MENINFKPFPDTLRNPVFRKAYELLAPHYKANEKYERAIAIQGVGDAISRGIPSSLKGKPYTAASENQAIRFYLDILAKQQENLKEEKTTLEPALILGHRSPGLPNTLQPIERLTEIGRSLNYNIGESVAIAAYIATPKPAPQPPTSSPYSSAGAGPIR